MLLMSNILKLYFILFAQMIKTKSKVVKDVEIASTLRDLVRG